MDVIEITSMPQKTEKIRLAPYARVSSKSEDQLLSFANQVQYYSEYVQAHPEYTLVDIYADEGITGTEMDKRDDLLRLLRDCKAGKVDRIITKSISRFVRNIEEQTVTLRMLKDMGISVYFEEQDIDTAKLDVEMIATLPGLAAQKESENISENMHWSYQHRMATGEYNCTLTPYGYERVDGNMVIKESEAVIIRQIFERYLAGDGMQEIANMLNANGTPRRFGQKLWRKSTIRYLLNNERYMGDALLQKTYKEGFPYRKKRNHGERPKYYVENSNPPIVSKETFTKAQELLRSRQSESCRRINHLLSGKVRCPECGGTFRRQVNENNAYWMCMRTAAGKEHCQSRRVREDMIYETFINMIYKLKEHREEILGALIRQIEILQDRASMNLERVRQIDKEVADLTAKNLVVTRLHTSGVLNATDFSAQTSEINNKILQLRSERRKKLAEEENSALGDLKELNEIIANYPLSSRFNQELFDLIIEKITVDDSTKITFSLIGGLALTEEIREVGRSKAV